MSSEFFSNAIRLQVETELVGRKDGAKVLLSEAVEMFDAGRLEEAEAKLVGVLGAVRGMIDYRNEARNVVDGLSALFDAEMEARGGKPTEGLLYAAERLVGVVKKEGVDSSSGESRKDGVGSDEGAGKRPTAAGLGQLGGGGVVAPDGPTGPEEKGSLGDARLKGLRAMFRLTGGNETELNQDQSMLVVYRDELDANEDLDLQKLRGRVNSTFHDKKVRAVLIGSLEAVAGVRNGEVRFPLTQEELGLLPRGLREFYGELSAMAYARGKTIEECFKYVKTSKSIRLRGFEPDETVMGGNGGEQGIESDGSDEGDGLVLTESEIGSLARVLVDAGLVQEGDRKVIGPLVTSSGVSGTVNAKALFEKIVKIRSLDEVGRRELYDALKGKEREKMLFFYLMGLGEDALMTLLPS